MEWWVNRACCRNCGRAREDFTFCPIEGQISEDYWCGQIEPLKYASDVPPPSKKKKVISLFMSPP